MKRKSPRRQHDGPTLADVARHAGVSPMTVSRVINGEVNVRENTRELVNKAIQALGYSPNQAARSLAGANQIRIGLLYSNPSAAYLSAFLLGGLEQASLRHVQLIVEKCEVGKGAADTAKALVQSGVEGVLLPPPLSYYKPVLKALKEAEIPTVAIVTSSPKDLSRQMGMSLDNVSTVSIDDYQAAFSMTQHIIGLGHQRVGFILGDPNNGASELRRQGYVDAMLEAGLEVPDELVIQGLFTYLSGLDAAEQLLDLKNKPTAIFASNDDMAAATVAVAHRRGMDVPGDLTVCGFDDSALATTIWPELTTIHQPISEMSRASIDLVLTKIREHRDGNGGDNQSQLLDYTLIRRQSDGPPRVRPSATKTKK